MIRLGSLADWEFLKKKEYFQIPSTRSARTTLEFNSPNKVGIWYYPLKQKDKYEIVPDTSNEATFLCYVEGYQSLQFVHKQPIALMGDADFALKTNVGMTKHTYEATESFTKIIERRSMSPEALAIHQQSKMRELQFNQQLAAQDERFKALEAAINKQDKSSSSTSDAQSSTQSQKASDGGASTQDDATGGTGDDSQDTNGS